MKNSHISAVESISAQPGPAQFGPNHTCSPPSIVHSVTLFTSFPHQLSHETGPLLKPGTDAPLGQLFRSRKVATVSATLLKPAPLPSYGTTESAVP